MSLREVIEELAPEPRRVLDAYMSRAERLDGILAMLTRAFCARCPRSARYGCCDFAAEAVRELPPEAIRLQEAECLENGGSLQQAGGICRYHSAAGCCLRLTKSPSCLGHLCDDLRKWLGRAFPAQAGPFVSSMRAVMSGSLQQDSAGLLAAMEEAIAAGDRLLTSADLRSLP